MTRFTAIAIALILFAVPALAGDRDVTMWKSPQCGCCKGWGVYLQRHGYNVTMIDIDDVDAVKDRLGVPPAVRSCHTAKVGNYVVEGHVPVEAIDKLLAEKPKVTGIASPGMPSGSPGMNGPKEPNPISSFTGSRIAPFSD
jgi:hypothetical protein